MRYIPRMVTFGASLLVALAGCFVGRELTEPSIPRGLTTQFSHQFHIEDQGLECNMCHAGATTADAAGMPAFDPCNMCHEGIDPDKPEGRRATVYLRDGAPQWSQYTRLPDENIFSHKAHHDAGVQCAQCHTGIEESVSVNLELALDMDECMACHRRRASSNNCATCHSTIGREWRPPTHDDLWIQMHGNVVTGAGLEPDKRIYECSLCHTESACARCHQDQPPRSHNQYWRQQGHGLQASIDRERCATCHRADFCDRCHQETAPRTHSGTWAAITYTHCMSCHHPLQDNSCFVCHKRAITSHIQQAPLALITEAHRNATADQCRLCHLAGGANRLDHSDNGEDCRICHRF